MHFYSYNSISNIDSLIQSALHLKKDQERSDIGKDKTIVMVFLNPSLRTRISSQEAAYRLGMNVICINSTEAWPWELEEGVIMDGNKAEHIKDAAKVISSYADVIGIRCFAGLQDKDADASDKLIKLFMKYSSVPVINLESATLHPCQSLTDMVTLEEIFPKKKLKIALSWAPHPKALPHAVANSFAQWALGQGHELNICHPQGFELDISFTDGASIYNDQVEAFKNVDVVYTKNWCSSENYGQPSQGHNEWIINQEKMAFTNNAKFMHCLPVRRNVVVTDEVIDSNSSLVHQQAENRLYAAQAILNKILLAI